MFNVSDKSMVPVYASNTDADCELFELEAG